ncbi:DUF6768 family protein [Phenylobacterium sp.]|uniref:DUF6768 family protein n=1 Tax=Phenylobacterium sp. TaxID=1871053 RepID=UPI0030F42B6C
MSKVDEAIRRALSPEDVRAYDALGQEQSIIAEAMQAFQAQHRLVAVGGWLAGFSLFAVAAWAGWRFWQAADTRDMLLWGALAGVALSGLGLVKLWFWMEMQKNAIVRELKRLELQVASLIAASAP